MEDENKEKNILTDEELKEVAGGKKTNGLHMKIVKDNCAKLRGVSLCIQCSDCAWISGECVPNPNKYEY